MTKKLTKEELEEIRQWKPGPQAQDGRASWVDFWELKDNQENLLSHIEALEEEIVCLKVDCGKQDCIFNGVCQKRIANDTDKFSVFVPKNI